MKKKQIQVLIFSLLFCGLIAFSRAADPLTGAVLDFQVAPDVHGPSGADLAGLISVKLSASTSLVLVERQELDKLLGEHELGASGAEKSPDKIGQLLGAQVLISGRLFSAGSTSYLVTKVMSVETGRVFGDLANFKGEADIPNAVDQITQKIGVILDKHSNDLVAKPESIDTEFQQLKTSLAGKKLPSISVSIAERQIGTPAVDPAAQTTMLHYLQQLGFKIIDPGTSDQKPEVTITGEAFSEFGLRKGNLISCKARVEVKVTQRSSGTLLFTDAQKGVAFDLGETSTGKAALEKTAAKLLIRIVPALSGN